MDHINPVLFLLALLFIKHWYIDFVDQSTEEVNSKGIYGDGPGIAHSAKHGIATLMCILVIMGQEFFLYAVLLAIMDFVLHYHIDWVKMNYGNRDITTNQFWNHLGLDQLAHYLVYLSIAKMVTL